MTGYQTAQLDIKIIVECPNHECGELIDLLKKEDTNYTDHDDGGILLRQIFSSDDSHNDFGCNDVVCTKCKTVFNVRELYCVNDC